MIITQLTLENYKQYRGEHTFQIAEDATVGVVGANGVGKTTIFEAIEWCLYKPTSISNKDIRPRGVGGEVRVVVQLTTNAGDAVYEVERVLKRSSTQATVYKLNEMGGGEPVVQGTREVTDHISTRLIGLGHAAFVATFFTRQKELSFFGNMQATARRREVGKLLGFETIKQAQALIADDRSKARADAESLQRQYDAKTENRDVKAEIAAAKDAIATQHKTVEEATTALTCAEKATATTETRLQELQEQRDRYTAIVSELRNLETRHQHANERETSIVRELAQLDRREEERTRLAGTAAEEPELRAERLRLEAERERHQARERLLSEMNGCGQTVDRAVADLRALVERTREATNEPGWRWSQDDQSAPMAGIDRLVAIASSVDVPSADQQLNGYRAALVEQETLNQESAKLRRYQDRVADINAELDGLMKDGEPADHRAALEAQQADTRTRRSNAQATIASITPQRERAQELANRLEQQHFDDACPTCGRPFNDDEAELVIGTLRESIRRHDAAIGAARADAAAAEKDARRLQQELHQVQQQEAQVQKCRASLESAREYIGQQEAAVEAVRTRLTSALERIGQPSAPSQADVDAAEREVSRRRMLLETVEPLRMLRRSIGDARDAMARHEQDLSSLVDIAWEPDAYREVSERHTAASNAASAIEQIDRELARRPQLEHDLATTREQIAGLTSEIDVQATARDAVGFDAAVLQEVTTGLQQARQAEREHREHLQKADRAAREAGYRLETLEKEETQLAELIEQATVKRQLKDELDLMYNEFSEFDKFVAQHLSPRLSEMTSDIVADMTDGTYDRVEFDEDYGIEVFDGTGEKFALETFSGGERDAIALAARLALSRMVGSQAANPPGFLVLDEVFGSLDAERRERVLTLLGQHSHEYFRQMFIISHVDDVQQSPVFDTVWQVVQQEDGTSDVQRGGGEGEAMLAG